MKKNNGIQVLPNRYKKKKQEVIEIESVMYWHSNRHQISRPEKNIYKQIPIHYDDKIDTYD